MVTAMYQKPKITKYGRPIMVPPASRTDMVVEAISLAGLLFNIGIVIFVIINLHENTLTNAGSYGYIWVLPLFLFIANVLIYVLMTIVNRYPYYLNYPTIITEENAPKLYHLACSMMRWMKTIFVWMITSVTWEFIMVLPYHPAQSIDSLLIFFAPPIITIVVVGYYVIKIFTVSHPKNKTNNS
jgi:hypothetical protein